MKNQQQTNTKGKRFCQSVGQEDESANLCNTIVLEPASSSSASTTQHYVACLASECPETQFFNSMNTNVTLQFIQKCLVPGRCYWPLTTLVRKIMSLFYFLLFWITPEIRSIELGIDTSQAYVSSLSSTLSKSIH
jgi:hypothetical protein